MKISDILQQPSALPASKKGERTEARDVDFQQFLDDARTRRAEGLQTLPSPSARDVENPSAPPVSAASFKDLSENREMAEVRSLGIRAAEDTLRILEQYQKAIGNPETTLRQIEPLTKLLSQEASHLRTMAEKMDLSDPLQKIVTDLGIVSTVEIEKFNRGEYV